MSHRSKIRLWIAALLLIAGPSILYVGGQDTALRTPSYALATVERGELIEIVITGEISDSETALSQDTLDLVPMDTEAHGQRVSVFSGGHGILHLSMVCVLFSLQV